MERGGESGTVVPVAVPPPISQVLLLLTDLIGLHTCNVWGSGFATTAAAAPARFAGRPAQHQFVRG